MDKKLTIYNYLEKPTEIIIPDFEKVKTITCRVIIGDEVLVVNYNDGSSKVFDSYPLARFESCKIDGEVNIPLDQINIISTIPNSYNLLAHFGDTKAEERAINKILEEKF